MKGDILGASQAKGEDPVEPGEVLDIPRDGADSQLVVGAHKLPGLRAIAERMANAPISPNFQKLEVRVDELLGNTNSNITRDGVKDLLDNTDDPKLQMAAYCKMAIYAVKNDNDLDGAESFLAKATVLEVGSDAALPKLIYAEINSAVSILRMREGPLAVAGEVLKTPLSGYVPEALEQIERAVTFNLEEPIRPSRSLVSRVEAGDLPLFRRQSPDFALIQREEKILRYFKRLNKHLDDESRALLQVPQVLGSVKVFNREEWALYTEFKSGDNVAKVLDEIRLFSGRFTRAQTRGQDKAMNDAKTLLRKTISTAVRQSAHAIAYGPVELADKIDEPLERYYNERLNTRIIKDFDRFLKHIGDELISSDDKATLLEGLEPIHEHLASLDPVFYKDSWYGNSIMISEGENIHIVFYDFESVKKLPPVIELATQLCYGGYANNITRRTDRPECKFIEEFYRTYSGAVDKYNNLVWDFHKDKLAFFRAEIMDDIENCSDGKYCSSFTRLLELTQDYDFKSVEDSFKKIKNDVKRVGLDVPGGYIDDLEVFIINLELKVPVDIPGIGTKKYKNVMDEFKQDYYAALVHRSLVLASTFAKFSLTQGIPERERNLIVREIGGTLGNAVRGINRTYENFNRGVSYMNEDQRDGLLRVVRSIKGKVDAAVRYGKF